MIVSTICHGAPRRQAVRVAGLFVRLILLFGLLGIVSPARAQMDPPGIVTQPSSRTNIAGSTVNFDVTTSGTEPLAYQWVFQDTNLLVAATNASLVLSNVQSANAGGYSVIVTNDFGSVTSEVAILIIEPAADLALGVATPLPLVAVGGLFSFTINVTNRGPSPSGIVTLTSQLSPATQFLSSSASLGSCTNDAGLVTCVVSNLNSGGRFSVTLNVNAGAGTNFCLSTVAAAAFDPVPGNNSATASTVGTHSLVQFLNGDSIVFDEIDRTPGSIYPSTINVSGLTSQVFKVTVTLQGITHTFPDDLDLLLVGPGGQTVMLMSDCGLDNGITDVTLTLDDDAATSLPDSDPAITTGTYKPSNYGSLDIMDAPAPPRPYGTQLLAFRGTNPNGTWSLYAMDDLPENGGVINDGWSLSLVTSDPIADLAVGQSANLASVAAGSNLTYTINVTNRGPADSRAMVTNTLPPSVTVVSAVPSQGTCNTAGGVVTCDLGNILSGATKQVVLVVTPLIGGLITNSVTVTGSQVDLVPTNNTAPPLVTTVLPLADLAVTLTVGAPTSLLAQPVLYTIQITNRGPNTATNVLLTDILPNLMTFVSATNNQGGCTNAAGVVTCGLGVIPAGGAVTITLSGSSGALGSNSNFVHVGSAQLDPSQSNNNAQINVMVLSNADFQLTSFPGSSLLLSQNWSHVLILSNRGPNSSAASLASALPAALQFISATPSQGVCSNGPAGLLCQLDPIPPNQQATVVVVSRPIQIGPITNTFTATGTLPDPDSSNNSVTVTGTVVLNADLDLTIAAAPDPIWLGEDVTFQLLLTNRGPNQASGVAVTNVIPAGFSFVSATSSRGSCSHVGNTVACTIGTMLPVTGAGITIIAHSLTTGFFTNTARAISSEVDPNPANNLPTRAVRVISSSGQFTNTSPVSIPTLGAASPFPSTILVSGLTAAVYRVRVTLTNFAHSYPDDLDVLLVGPEGQSILLMSDAGGEFGVTNLTLTFDEDASVPLPDAGPLASGIFLPIDYEPGVDVFPSPAPQGPYATDFAVFHDTNPNGVWSLYVLDDAAKDAGILGGGWSLNFFTQDPIADLTLTQQLTANPAAISNHLVFTYLVTNRGPAIATSVQLTNILDPSLNFLSVTSTAGACTNVGGVISCALPPLASGASTTVTLDVIPTVLLTFTNRVATSAAERDLHPENNVTDVVVEVLDPPLILVQPVGLTVTNGTSISFTSAVSGSAPLVLQWQRNGLDLPGATNSILSVANVTALDSGNYRLRASNPAGTAFSDPAQLRVLGPPSISDLPDQVIDEDSATGQIPFLVDDVESPPNLINVTGQSSNTNLVSTLGLHFTGTGSNRTVQVTPLPNANGQSTISVFAQDPDGGVTVRSFSLTVRPVNDPPTISPVTNQATLEDTPLVIQFLADDLETASSNLLYTFTSTNPSLFPSNSVVFGGSNSLRSATFLPATNQFGSATITLVADDGSGSSASSTFTIVVVPVNDAPSLDIIPDMSIAEDSGPRIIPLSGITSGASNEPQNLQLTVQSGNPALLAAPVLAYNSPDNTGSLTLTPLTNATGTTLVTVTVTDGGSSNQLFSRTFTLTVTPTNDPPILTVVPAVATPEDVPILVAVSLRDPDDAAGSLTFSAVSLNTNLVQNSGLTPGGTNQNRFLQIIPVTNATGVVSIQLIATDPQGASVTNILTLTLLAVNDPPTLGALSNLVIPEDAGVQSVPLTGITSGAPNESQTITLTAASSNPSLIPVPGIVYTSPNPTGTLNFASSPNAVGTATLSVTADDGAGGLTTRSFQVTITPTNDAPVILSIGSQSTPEDTTLPVPFTVLDAETPSALLIVTATSSDSTLVNSNSIVFDGGGSNRIVYVTPQTNQFGTATITLFVSDGTATNSTAFLLTVTAVNDAPTINPLPNFVTNSASGNPAFVIPINGITSGAANETQTLTVTATSSNTGLMPNPTVSYLSPNTNGTITLRPGNNSTGSSLITVTVSDGSASNSQSFVANIKSSGNVLPTISVITNRTIGEDTSAGPISFTIRDAETAAANLSLVAASSNPVLLPVANILLGGTDTNRTITLTPATNQTGIAAITLTVTDAGFGSSNMTFTLTVTATNDPPFISAITNRSTPEDTLILVPFAVSDLETPAGNLTVTAISSNLTLVPSVNLGVGGSGTNRVLVITPATNQTGTATIAVRVTDGVLTNGTSFVLTVTGVNDPPTISSIPNQSTPEDTPVGSIPFIVQDIETAPGSLTLSASSSNPSLVATSNISFGGSSSNRTVTLVPQPNASGSALITIIVSDGSATATNAFILTVVPVNDPPALAAIADVRVNQNSGPRTVPLTGISAGSLESNQVAIVSASTTDTNLLRILGVEYSGGATGLLTLQPLAGATGTGTVTVVVFDGDVVSNSVTRSFHVSINAAPAISYVPDIATLESTPTAPISIAIGDAENSANQLNVSFAAPGPLFPSGSAAFTGTNAQRSLVLTPATGLNGTALGTVTVTDAEGATASVSFFVSVTHSNRPPTVDAITNQTTLEDTPVTVAFTIGDVETPAASLVVTGYSSSILIPAANMQFGGSGSNRTVTLLGLTNASGNATITLVAVDAMGAATSNSFDLAIQPVTDPINIVTQPQGTNAEAGITVVFQCVAESGLPPRYQWQKNGTALPGATTTSLILTNISVVNAGTYTCLVTNDDAVSVLSAPANLTVVGAPVLLGITRTGTVATLRYSTFPGSTNTIEYKVLVNGTNWNPLNPIVATGSVMTAPDPAATNGTRFYRVKTE